MKFIAAALTSLAISVSTHVNASLIIDNSADPSTDVFVEFDTPTLADNSIVTNQFSAFGVDFDGAGTGPVIYNGCTFGEGLVSNTGMLTTFQAPCNAAGSPHDWGITFSSAISELDLLMAVNGGGSVFNLKTFLNGFLVNTHGTTNGSWSTTDGDRHYHINEARFDRLVFRSTISQQYARIDNLSYSLATNVPEPSTLAIFALGMIGLASRRFKKQSI